MFSLGLMSFYFLSPNLWHYYLIYVVIGMVGSGVSPVPYYNVISHWFDRKRGLALGLSMIGVGLSELLTPSFTQALIGTIGWRTAYLVLGIIVAAVTFPVVALFLKEKPQQLGLLPDGVREISERAERETGPPQGMTANQAWRTGVFWLMSAGLFLVSMSLTGCLVHLVPMLKDRGMSAANAALAISLLGGANLLGRVLTGYLLDRVFAASVAFFFFCGAAVGIFMLLMGATGGLAFVAALLVGLGMGAEGDIMAYIVGRYFGLLAFGEIYGYVLAIYTLGAMLGPVIMGLSFDLNGDYKIAMTGFVAVTLLGAALMTQLGPYRTWSTAEAGAD
jgi:MFS family permease